MSTQTLKILNTESDDEDYIIELQLPNGLRIKVLIPINKESPYGNFLEKDGVYGLNLITEGHYT